MSQRQQLLTMHSMLEHVADEASRCGYGMIATLSAAAAEAAQDEMKAISHRERRAAAPSMARRKERVAA